MNSINAHSASVKEAERIMGISNGVTIPTWLFAGGSGLVLGIMLGPAIMASTGGGSRYLARIAREKIEGK